jgi:hypothetical protein
MNTDSRSEIMAVGIVETEFSADVLLFKLRSKAPSICGGATPGYDRLQSAAKIAGGPLPKERSCAGKILSGGQRLANRFCADGCNDRHKCPPRDGNRCDRALICDADGSSGERHGPKRSYVDQDCPWREKVNPSESLHARHSVFRNCHRKKITDGLESLCVWVAMGHRIRRGAI